MFDVQVTPEVADAIAEIGRVDPRYHSPEGKMFRKALALIADERDWHQSADLRDGWIKRDGRVCRCSYAALSDTGIELWSPVHNALFLVMDKGVNRFNADHTHAEVIAKWHEAGHANGWL